MIEHRDGRPIIGQWDRASGEHHLPRRRPARPDQMQVEHG
jgi:hypothetical protein